MSRLQESRQAASNLGERHRAWTEERPEMSTVQGGDLTFLSFISLFYFILKNSAECCHGVSGYVSVNGE